MGPSHIEMFWPTWIKDKAKSKLSCITYEGTKFDSHESNKKESYFIQVKNNKEIIKDHCIWHYMCDVFNIQHPQDYTKKVDIFVQIDVFKMEQIQ